MYPDQDNDSMSCDIHLEKTGIPDPRKDFRSLRLLEDTVHTTYIPSSSNMCQVPPSTMHKKERLILDLEKQMTVETRINLMLRGFLNDIQDKLDRVEITASGRPLNKLEMYKDRALRQRKKIRRENKAPDLRWSVPEPKEKEPCPHLRIFEVLQSFPLSGTARCFNRNHSTQRKLFQEEL